MKKETRPGNYPFEWLDQMISVKLNPERTTLTEIPQSEVSAVEDRMGQETLGLLNYLKTRTFGRPEKKVRDFVVQYHETILTLMAQAKRNIADCALVSVVELSEKFIIALGELQKDVELRFGKYLSKARYQDVATKEANGFKVICQLSVDQLGILIKAADDIKLILSRSLSLIFRSLVPFLSTDRTKNISWMSMRKSTYQFEQADLDHIVEVLERMIKKIKGYY
ncbi:hypothetical protein [Mucilaginibacter terrae]|nr:hypothetical protein [Mucilaginibacter terrae]